MRASSAPTPSRRTVLATAAVTAAATALPDAGTAAAAPAHHHSDKHRPDGRHQPHRRRAAAIGGTGFVTGLLFHPAVKGLAYAGRGIQYAQPQ